MGDSGRDSNRGRTYYAFQVGVGLEQALAIVSVKDFWSSSLP